MTSELYIHLIPRRLLQNPEQWEMPSLFPTLYLCGAKYAARPLSPSPAAPQLLTCPHLTSILSPGRNLIHKRSTPILNPHFSCFNMMLQMYSSSTWTYKFKVCKPYQVTGAFEGYSYLSTLSWILKTGFPKVLNTVLFMVLTWQCLQMTTAYQKPIWKRDLLFIFGTICVMTLCFMYRDFPYLSCLTFFPENFQSVFLEIGRAEVNILFVQPRTESKRILSMFQKMLESRCHINNRRSSSIMASAWISKELSTSGCSSEHRIPHEVKG